MSGGQVATDVWTVVTAIGTLAAVIAAVGMPASQHSYIDATDHDSHSRPLRWSLTASRSRDPDRRSKSSALSTSASLSATWAHPQPPERGTSHETVAKGPSASARLPAPPLDADGSMNDGAWSTKSQLRCDGLRT